MYYLDHIQKQAKVGKVLLVAIQVLIAVLMNLVLCGNVYSLTSNEVLVLANSNFKGSTELAKYYSQKRKIPVENILDLNVTNNEKCSREDYEKKIAEPVRKFLKLNKDIKCIVTLFGVPLIVGSPEMKLSDKKEKQRLRDNKFKLEKMLLESDSTEKKEQLKDELAKTKQKIKQFNFKHNKGASIDSELSLVKQQKYSLTMWVHNPHFEGFKGKKQRFDETDVLMVARLDAPTYSDVKRIINDSLFAEENGLKGKAYFDAKGVEPFQKDLNAYAYYDKSIHLAADKINTLSLMPVVKDEEKTLFQPGQCPDAALYCGWYKLANYVDAFTWVRGSIGYHIASAECTTLKNQKSRVWCKMMLEKGIAATIGPVGEPYVQAFPLPELFFSLLTEGKRTLVECYFDSLPFVSWKMVLVGDPLYNPFKKNNDLK